MAKKAVKVPTNYENNPFFIAINGITLLFNLARGVAFLLVALSVVGLFNGQWSPDTANDDAAWDNFWHTFSGWSVESWLLAIGGFVIVGLAVLLIAALFGGVSAYTSAQLAKNKQVGLGEAFHVAFDNLWSFLWLQIIIFVKLVLWTLLFIVPGIIMATRYSLASVAFFDEDKKLRGDAAIKESIRLTRGAWITTYGANALFNFITLGIISPIVTVGVNAVLYRQFDKLDDKKPDAHWLSWIALVVPFALLGLLLAFVLFLVLFVGAANRFS